MMKPKKILFITQEMVPYVPESQMSSYGRTLPQSIQEKGFEIRSFMPKWGNINERRNQLHEVIRLSGMNIVINDTDHPLIIKVASIQAARMQVYFIDNDDYFQKRLMMSDEQGEEYADNTERAIFYARGVLETVKKLRWTPDIIHCHGWMSSIVPLYLKTVYKEEPIFANAKVVFSAYDEMPKAAPPQNFTDCLLFRSLTPTVLQETGIDLSQPQALGELAITFTDGFVQVGNNEALTQFAAQKQVNTLIANGEMPSPEAYEDFYNNLFDSVE